MSLSIKDHDDDRKISIDFTKLDFELAQMKLKKEIDRQRKYSTSIEVQLSNF